MDDVYQKIPKVELHRHLEGSIRPQTYFELARQKNLPMRTASRYQDGDERSLPAFLRKMLPIRYILTDPETLARVTCEAVEDAARDGTLYVEIRFSASHMLLQGMQPAEIAQGLCQGMAQAKRKTGVGGCLIAGITRELGPEMAEKITALAIGNMADGILGLDLFGDERIPPQDFCPFFQRAREAGLSITVHAGEGGGAENVHTAVEKLHACRIGHGVRSVEDEAVVRLLKERGVLLEVCPTSNVQTGTVPSLAQHPLPLLLRQGVPVSLSTDDPQFCGVDLCGEYRLAHEVLGVPLETLAGMADVAAGYLFDRDYEKTLRQTLAARRKTDDENRF